MPHQPLTQIGPLETLIARTAENALEAANVQSIVVTDSGIASRSAVTGNADAAVSESIAACIAHMLESTRHPVVTNFLIEFRDTIGLGD